MTSLGRRSLVIAAWCLLVGCATDRRSWPKEDTGLRVACLPWRQQQQPSARLDLVVIRGCVWNEGQEPVAIFGTPSRWSVHMLRDGEQVAKWSMKVGELIPSDRIVLGPMRITALQTEGDVSCEKGQRSSKALGEIIHVFEVDIPALGLEGAYDARTVVVMQMEFMECSDADGGAPRVFRAQTVICPGVVWPGGRPFN